MSKAKTWRNSRSLVGLGSAVVAALVLSACGGPSSQDSEPSATPSMRPTGTATQSGGCFSNEALNSGVTTRSVMSNGVSRDFDIYVPTAATSGTPLPVVYSFHGRGSTAAEQATLTGIQADAEANGYIAVMPQAIAGEWRIPLDGNLTNNIELAFVDELIDEVDGLTCTNPSLRYASGFSLGSVMTLVLACEPVRQFAAFGGVGAAFYQPICDASPPAPLIYFHGTQDQVVPYAGGTALGVPVAPVPESMAAWAAHNACTTGPETVTTADITLTTWQNCAANASVNFYTVDGGGHTWPGSPNIVAGALEQAFGTTTQTVAATSAMWEFFKNYQLSPTNSGVAPGAAEGGSASSSGTTP